MKSLDFLKHVDHSRKAAIYTAEHDGKLRNFAYSEELGECRETFSRLLHAVQEGEIGVVLTPDAASLAIETSPGWMEAFIQAVKQHEVLIGDHSHDLVYDLREEEDEARLRALFSPEEYERARSAPRPLVDAIAQSPFAAASPKRPPSVLRSPVCIRPRRNVPVVTTTASASTGGPSAVTTPATRPRASRKSSAMPSRSVRFGVSSRARRASRE